MKCVLNCAAVIPCLNESAAIARVVRGAREHIPAVFVIDDGSQDNTHALASEAGAEVLRHAAPRGKGAALQAGWMHARQCGYQWALTMDGDGQHDPGEIPIFLDEVVRTGAELVVGNRMAKPEGMPWLRRGVNRWMSGRISSLTGVCLPDSQCGFRLMNLQTWSELPITASRFEIESDVLVAFARRGCAIRFVPIRVIYKTEQSKIHPVRDTIRWFQWWRQVNREHSKYSGASGLQKHGSAVRSCSSFSRR